MPTACQHSLSPVDRHVIPRHSPGQRATSEHLRGGAGSGGVFSSAPQMGYRQPLMGRAGGYPLLYRNITFKQATDGLKPPTPNQTSELRCHPVSRCQPRVPIAAVGAGSLDPYPKATQHHHPALKTLAAREKP